MEPEEIAAQIEYCGSTFPRKAMEAVVADPEAATPHLLGIVERAAARFEELIQDRDYFGVVPAMFLLAQFREKRAYPLVVELFARHSHAFEKWCPDFITEDLHRILASVSGGDTELMVKLATTDGVNGYVRDAGIRAVLTLVVAGQKTRDEAMTLYKSLFQHPGAPRTRSMFWNGLVSCCTSLYPSAVMDDIHQAYEEGLVDPEFLGLDYIGEHLTKGKEAVLAELPKYHRGPITDAVKELGSWAAFQPKEKVRSSTLPRALDELGVVRDSPKIARNAPCPCGSGKKYKKCCGRSS